MYENTIDQIRAAKNTVELDSIVNAFLSEITELEASGGETYQETADRLREEFKSDEARVLRIAQGAWYELEDGGNVREK